ncbi:co-chaperone HscB [Psychrosphaera sp. B3R10]|uniref:Co-chaperone protein HscB homolog n=1 Tax=Psychrosphaera algicola TaxID=3023714 RepID=A0ABT5FCD4_9GAMM|nr:MULTISPECIES: co-chaperone HscB [unclassified Psychrosphaera]MBU2883624.1 co-chaperone HscB [Psychrosphaera sp. I2R16]MBU2989802.1 co-chaperone HscB [Psychrosphaera sp. B3R10]MDC2888602.1 co-chaperone HscB [Psychrosphaera sp. G1-22]MDO6719753.1 co-chaperone HscB [Psychrosphaera sp. 1_MG-2023]
MRYFSLFDLPVDFQVDTNLLTQRYRDIQKKVHPDNFASGSDRERLLAVQTSSEINDAFETLKHPLSRAEYMVMEHGFDVKHEQTTIKDGMFLMQQMELREELEDIETASDKESAFDDFYDDVKQLVVQYTNQFESLFNSQDYDSAAVAVRKLRFVYKLKSEAQQLEDKLLDD